MKPTIVLKLLPIILLVSCSSVDNYSYWEQESEEPYSQEYYPDTTSITVYTHTYEKWGGPASFYKYTIDVHKGMDLRKYLTWNSEYEDYCLIGLFTDPEHKHYLKASQIISYDYSFNSVYFYWEEREKAEDYIYRYHGTYRNYLGDELVVEYKGISYDLTLTDDIKLHFELSDFVFGVRYAIPYANTLKINGKKIENDGQGFEISNYYCNSYDEKTETFDEGASVLKNTFRPYVSDLLLNQYFESIGEEYRIGSKEFSAIYERLYYSADNKVTIRYDL